MKKILGLALLTTLIVADTIPSTTIEAMQPQCGLFSDMFQTRHSCGSSGGRIEFTNAGQTLDGSNYVIKNNPDNILTTCSVITPNWVLNQYQTCGEHGDCIASESNATALSIDYYNPPQTVWIDSEPAIWASNFQITTGNTSYTLDNSRYDEVYPKDGSITNYSILFDISGHTSLKINTIKTTIHDSFTFQSSDTYDLEIGYIKVKSNGSYNSFETDDNVEDIKIHKFEQTSNTSATFQAQKTIKMEEFYVGRGSNIVLKAPYIIINHFEPTNSGSGNTLIKIYADYIDMDYIELAQNVTVEIHPFTPGKRILFRNNNITESSSSTILLSSGNYYINSDLVIPGTSDVSALRALNENQDIDFFLNHDLQTGNNPGINALGNRGNFGPFAPEKFRLYINGHLKTGGGGTTFNATIYVEGNVDFGNPTYVRGAINAYDKVKIGQGQFIYDQNLTQTGWGKCQTPVPYQNHYSCSIFTSPLISYKEIKKEGNNIHICNSSFIAYPANALSGNGNIHCSQSGCGNGTCIQQNPPRNRLEYQVYDSSDSSSDNNPPDTLTEKEYGNLHYPDNSTVVFDPQNTYDDNPTKVMLLGDLILNSNTTLRFKPGDYYFQSITINGNNNNIELPEGGTVRIFVKNNMSIALNNTKINENGNSDDLFIYVGESFEDLGSGGGTSIIKAYIYVKNGVTIQNNAPTSFYGSVVAEDVITLDGNNIHFYKDGDPDKLGYGECPICYGDIKMGGMSFNFFNCGGMSMFQDIKVPIFSDRNIKNVEIDEAHKQTIFSWSFMSSYEVIDQDDNHIADAIKQNSGWNWGAMGMDMTLFGGKAIIYPLGSNYGPTSDDNYYQLHSSSMFSFSFDPCKWYESLVYVGHYDDEQGRHYDIQLSPCTKPPVPGNYTVTGPFDAWDVDRNINDRNISTKIVNHPFQLTIASLNAQNSALEQKNIGDINFSLYSGGVPITSPYTFDTNTKSNQNYTFLISEAYKNISVGFLLCSTYDVALKNHTLYDYSHCSGTNIYDCNVSTSTPVLRLCFSSDNFAIRPYSFKVFAKNQYKRAAEEFNVTIKAVDETNDSIMSGTVRDIKGTPNYNESLSRLNIQANFYHPTQEEIDQMQQDIGDYNTSINGEVAKCPHSGIFSTVGNPSFANGEVNATLKYSETGIFTLQVGEKDGQEFALVDRDDTPNTQRFIKPATMTLQKEDINKTTLMLFIPYKFVTTANFSTTTGENWIYMSNSVKNANTSFTTPTIAARIDYTIKAYNKDGSITQNYTKTCFPDTDEIHAPRVNGLKLNTTFDLFLDATFNLSHNINNTKFALYTEDNTSKPIWTPNKEISLSSIHFSTQEWVPPFIFENGIGKARVYCNIDRNVSKALTPIVISLQEANVSTSWMSNPGSPKIFAGDTAEQNVTFVYGRIHGADESINLFKTREGNVTLTYEIFDPLLADGTRQSQNDGITILNGLPNSIDNINWVINTKHTSENMGKIYQIRHKNAVLLNSDGTTGSDDTLTLLQSYPIDKGRQIITLKNNKTHTITAKLDINASSWLIYNRFNPNAKYNSFAVKFLAKPRWKGVGSFHKQIEANESTINHYRINW